MRSAPLSKATRPLSAILVAAMLLELTPAIAQPRRAPAPQAAPAPSPADAAAALKQAGNDALGALKPTEALDAYRKAYALFPDPALHYNMAHAMEALGDYPAALGEYEEFARVATPELRARVPRLTELIAEVRAHVTRVTIRSNVPGARVLVRDVAVGTTGPDGAFERAFPAGPASFEVAADGYAPHRQQVAFERGGAVMFDVTLVTRATAGVLRVSTTPVAGTIYVDDKEVGRAPTETNVSAGTHKIVVHADGIRDVTTQAVVAVGETREVMLDLEKTPAIYTRWWFWTGVAVIVAGGVVLTYAALKERAPDCGSLQPCQVQAQQVGFAVARF